MIHTKIETAKLTSPKKFPPNIFDTHNNSCVFLSHEEERCVQAWQHTSVIPELRRQGNLKFWASLGYKMRLSQEKFLEIYPSVSHWPSMSKALDLIKSKGGSDKLSQREHIRKEDYTGHVRACQTTEQTAKWHEKG